MSHPSPLSKWFSAWLVEKLHTLPKHQIYSGSGCRHSVDPPPLSPANGEELSSQSSKTNTSVVRIILIHSSQACESPQGRFHLDSATFTCGNFIPLLFNLEFPRGAKANSVRSKSRGDFDPLSIKRKIKNQLKWFGCLTLLHFIQRNLKMLGAFPLVVLAHLQSGNSAIPAIRGSSTLALVPLALANCSYWIFFKIHVRLFAQSKENRVAKLAELNPINVVLASLP